MRILFLLLVAALTIFPSIDAFPKGFLKISNGKIVDEDMNVVKIRGINAPSGYWFELDKEVIKIKKSPTPFTEEIMKELVSYGANCIRVPTIPYKFFNEDLEKIPEDRLRHYDRIIELAKKYNVYIILEFHKTTREEGIIEFVRKLGAKGTGYEEIYGIYDRLWVEDKYRKQFISFWRQMAERYKDETAIAGYDLFGEPVTRQKGRKKLLKKVYEELVEEIRKIDKSHIIFLEGASIGYDFSIFPIEGDNIGYSFHWYDTFCYDKKGIMKYPGMIKGQFWNKDSMEKKLKPYVDFKNKYNAVVWVGEFGNWAKDRESAYRWYEDVISIFEKNDIHWCTWGNPKERLTHATGIQRDAKGNEIGYLNILKKYWKKN